MRIGQWVCSYLLQIVVTCMQVNRKKKKSFTSLGNVYLEIKRSIVELINYFIKQVYRAFKILLHNQKLLSLKRWKKFFIFPDNLTTV